MKPGTASSTTTGTLFCANVETSAVMSLVEPEIASAALYVRLSADGMVMPPSLSPSSPVAPKSSFWPMKPMVSVGKFALMYLAKILPSAT